MSLLSFVLGLFQLFLTIAVIYVIAADGYKSWAVWIIPLGTILSAFALFSG